MPINPTLPVPPSVNHYWKPRRGGGLYVGEEGQAFKAEVGRLCRAQGLTSPLTGHVVVHLRVFRPKNSGDLDNYLKALFDAIKGYVYVDDKQVYECHAYKDLDRLRPRVELVIDELAGQPKRRRLF